MKRETYKGRKIKVVAGRGADWGYTRITLNGVDMGKWLRGEDEALRSTRGTIDHADEVGVSSARYGNEWYAPGTYTLCDEGHAMEIGGECGHSWCVAQRAEVSPVDESEVPADDALDTVDTWAEVGYVAPESRSDTARVWAYPMTSLYAHAFVGEAGGNRRAACHGWILMPAHTAFVSAAAVDGGRCPNCETVLAAPTHAPGLNTAEYWDAMSAGPVARRDVHPTVTNGAQDTRSAWVRELGEQSFTARRPLSALDYAKRVADLLNEAAAAGHAVSVGSDGDLYIKDLSIEAPWHAGESWTVAE